MHHAASLDKRREPSGRRRRVLVINSVDDGLTERRTSLQLQSPQLAAFEVRHSYAVLLPRDLRNAHPEAVMRFVTAHGLDKVDFYNRIEQTVKSFNPSISFVHAGFVFHEFTSQFMAVLRELQAAHPTLNLAIQPRALRLINVEESNIFTRDSDIDSLMNVLF